AIPAGKVVGPQGRVIGVDLADRLLAMARAKAAARKLQNIEAVASARIVVSKAVDRPGITPCESAVVTSICPAAGRKASLNLPIACAMPIAVPMNPKTGSIQAYTCRGT